MQLQPFRCHYT